jgi:hypothetical protein
MLPAILPDNDYHRVLDAWHLRLAVLFDAFDQTIKDCFRDSSDDGYEAVFGILLEDFRRQLESCPFPPALGVSDEQ